MDLYEYCPYDHNGECYTPDDFDEEDVRNVEMYGCDGCPFHKEVKKVWREYNDIC